jgi:hypothetical protein
MEVRNQELRVKNPPFFQRGIKGDFAGAGQKENDAQPFVVSPSIALRTWLSNHERTLRHSLSTGEN